MEPTPVKELLLTTLAVRDSRNRTARLKLGRLVALFAGIATVLLVASKHPAKAAGMSSMLPEGAGVSISVPLGDAAAARPTVQVFALVGSDDPVRFDINRPVERQRVAFSTLAIAGGAAGVSAWPSRQRPDVRSGQDRTAAAAKRRVVRPVPVRSAASEIRRAEPAARERVSRAEARRTARVATLSYQRLLRQYQTLPQTAPRAEAHARLMNAYRVALAWRTFAARK